jgi:hypothetical protein
MGCDGYYGRVGGGCGLWVVGGQCWTGGAFVAFVLCGRCDFVAQIIRL